MTRTECDICLSQSDGVLLLPLAWDRSFSRLSSVEQNELERQILAILQDQGFTKLAFYNQLDYELLSAGIKDLNDPEQRAKISASLGYSYLLGISLDNTRNSEGWDYSNSLEAYEMMPPITDMEISASMRVALIETQTGKIISDNAISTDIPGWGMSDDAEGQNYWNINTISLAIKTATRQGIKFMVDDCEC
jgi:hypothetical protein